MTKLIVILLLSVIIVAVANFWSVSFRDHGRKVATRRTVLLILFLIIFSVILSKLIKYII